MEANNESESRSQDEESLSEDGEDAQHGFTPMEADERPKDSVVETPEIIELRSKINQLLCRYPELTPRSSEEILKKLKEYDVEALRNILQNCLNDLQKVRGTPTAECVIYLVASLVEILYIPNYVETCIKDEELKRDIESEVTYWLGCISNRMNIVFRFLNNAYTCVRRNNAMTLGTDAWAERFPRENVQEYNKLVQPIQTAPETRQTQETFPSQ
jgi:hypothetical protein